MSTILDIKNFLAIQMGKTSVSDLTINGVDTGLAAINAARRKAERAHDFKLTETDVLISIGNGRAELASAYSITPSGATVTGTLSPDATGDSPFTQHGFFNGLPMFMSVSLEYILWYSGTRWGLADTASMFTSNFWLGSATATLEAASGSYPSQGNNSGTATVVLNSGVNIKRIQAVMLPVADGGYQPVEFMTGDSFTARVQRQIGRQPYDVTKSLDQLGVQFSSPVAYQSGGSIYIYPSPGTVVAQLNVTRWMPDYTSNGDSDFFAAYAPDYLQWQALLEINKYFRRFVGKQEGNIDEASIKAMSDEALAALIAWDEGTARSTIMPGEQLQGGK